MLELQLAEVQVTGEDYRNELSAPLVSGRDFVAQRLVAAMSVSEQALVHAKQFAQHVQRTVEIGTSAPIELEVSRTRIAELTMAIDTLQRKLDIRRQFLAGKMDKIETELRVLEAEADQQVNTIQPKLNLAQQQTSQLAARMAVGAAPEVEVVQARLHLLELELALGKARLDLAVVRKRLQEHRGGRL